MKKISKYTKEINITQKIFNEYIRQRDKIEDYIEDYWICISCQKKINKPHAGHYFDTKYYPYLRFNDDNVNVQCPFCNTYRNGNLISYRYYLLQKIGKERLDNLEQKGLFGYKKLFTYEELKNIQDIYQNKIKNGKMGT